MDCVLSLFFTKIGVYTIKLDSFLRWDILKEFGIDKEGGGKKYITEAGKISKLYMQD